MNSSVLVQVFNYLLQLDDNSSGSVDQIRWVQTYFGSSLWNVSKDRRFVMAQELKISLWVLRKRRLISHEIYWDRIKTFRVSTLQM